MNDTIIVENNSGAFATIAKMLGNRAVLGLLVVLLVGLRAHDWWYQEDVCEARYVRADKAGKRRVARQNAGVAKSISQDLGLNRQSMSGRAQVERRAAQKMDWYKGKTKATIPADIHGAIQKVR